MFELEKDWKNLLAGGFAYLTAPFAGHPLDKKRAINMFLTTKIKNISLAKILKEAKKYLLSQGVNPDYVSEDINDVKEFYDTMNEKVIKQTKKSAWIITLIRNYGQSDETEKLILVKDARTSVENISKFIKDYYVSTYYPLSMKIFLSSGKENNPYQLRFYKNGEKREYYFKMLYGDNPVISARIVKNFKFHIDKNRKENLYWDEIIIKSS